MKRNSKEDISTYIPYELKENVKNILNKSEIKISEQIRNSLNYAVAYKLSKFEDKSLSICDIKLEKKIPPLKNIISSYEKYTPSGKLSRNNVQFNLGYSKLYLDILGDSSNNTNNNTDNTENFSDVCSCSLYIYMCKYLLNTKQLISPFNFIGCKNKYYSNNINNIATNAINKYDLTNYIEPCIGTLNLYLNIAKNNQFSKSILSDKDKLHINFYTVIQKNFAKFIFKLYQVKSIHPKLNKETLQIFETHCNDWKDNSKYGTISTDIAVEFFISYKHGRHSTKVRINWNYCLKHLEKVFNLHIFLNNNNVTLSENDLLITIQKNNSSKNLLVVDPPYISSEETFKEKFEEHEELSELLNKYKGKFILCYRSTCANNIDDKISGNRGVCGRLQKLYGSKQNYIMLIRPKNLKAKDNPIEVIITNFYFEGCRSFNDLNLYQETKKMCNLLENDYIKLHSNKNNPTVTPRA